jgi:predicted transcriptional regulator of viral defense system
MKRRRHIEIRRRDVANYKTALHRAGIKRLPTLSTLTERGILREVGRGRYQLTRKRNPMGAV